MTTLADIFEQLTYGELSQVKIGGLDLRALQEEVRPEHYKHVMAYINLGLKELYKRFFLSSKQLIVRIYDHIEVYKLDSRYAITNTEPTDCPKYIMDSPVDPYKDDLLKIEQIYNSCGINVPLNDLTDVRSVFTPQYNTIQVPCPSKYDIMSVHYRASHPSLEWKAGMNPKDIEVLLPEALMEPLLFYIAARFYTALDTDQGQQGSVYTNKFEASCLVARGLGYQVTPEYGNLKLDLQGWV